MTFLPEIAFAQQNMTQAFSPTQLIDLIASEPRVAIAVAIQILMGLALGYIMVKVFKYVIAFIIVLIIGSLLNVWSLGNNTEDILSRFSSEIVVYKDVIMNIITTLGVLLVGPITVGFFLGLLIGWMKK